jgi:hypothetical protein
LMSESVVGADDDEVDEIEVDEVEWRGRSYLVDATGTLYDDSHSVVGVWGNHATENSEPVFA